VKLPKLGQGTWGMGDDASRRAGELRALRTGIESRPGISAARSGATA